ncbi:MAG: murein biosynthesis integral membrane protein MurJ [Anaerovoracaceae bacterium]
MRTAAKTAAMMAILTLGLKGLGFLREVFMAGFFGTSYITDAYVMASSIPGIIFAGVFTSVAVSYMPIFSQIVEKQGIEKGNRFTNEAINLIMVVAFFLSVLGIIFSDQVVSIFAVGFKGQTAALTSFYLKITFLYVVFTAVSGILEAYLQYRGSFLKPILAGYLQSGFVLIAIVISAYYSHYFLAWGLLIGSALRTVAIVHVAGKKGFSYKLTVKISNSAKQIAILAVPVFIGSTVNQINSFVDKMLASGLDEGSVSALNYGYLLITLITSLTITIVVTIIYPKLTQAVALKERDNFNDAINKGFNINLIIGLPCSLGAMLYSQPAVQLIFERGAFDAASTALTGSAFFYYSIGLTFIGINALLVKVYYAMQDMKHPVICGVFGAATNIILNLLLVDTMAHRGLALATSIAAIVNSVLLYQILQKKYPHVRVVNDRAKLGKIILSATASVGISWAVYAPLAKIAAVPNIVTLGLAVIVACLVYLLSLKMFKVEEIDMLKQVIKFK